MSGLPWFKVASDFPGHPKTLRLCSILQDPNAGMYVIRLLSYCATYSPEGRIPLDMLAHAAGWKKQRVTVEFLASSLETAGFIVCTEAHAEIHGWDEWNGAHVRKCAKDNARARSDYRVPRAGTSRDPRGNLSGSRAGDVEGEKSRIIQKQLPSAEASSAGHGEQTAGLFDAAPAPPAPPAPAPAAAETPPPKAKRPPTAKSDPRHQPVRLMLARVYAEQRRNAEMPWGGEHAGALSKLLASVPSATVEEFERRWRYALGLRAYPGTSDPLLFLRKWAEYVPPAANGTCKANGGIRPAGAKWWDLLTPDERQRFMRERHEIAPELDAAPFDVAGEHGHERGEVVAFLARWREQAARRATA